MRQFFFRLAFSGNNRRIDGKAACAIGIFWIKLAAFARLSLLQRFLQNGLVAQLVEQRPFKPLVQGSSPCQPTPPCAVFLFRLAVEFLSFSVVLRAAQSAAAQSASAGADGSSFQGAA